MCAQDSVWLAASQQSEKNTDIFFKKARLKRLILGSRKNEWHSYQTKIWAFKRNSMRFFKLLYKQNINSNTFEMYYHHTKFSGFVLFYLIKWTLTSWNFNGGRSSGMRNIRFESSDCSLSRNVFKVLKDPPPLKV